MSSKLWCLPANLSVVRNAILSTCKPGLIQLPVRKSLFRPSACIVYRMSLSTASTVTPNTNTTINANDGSLTWNEFLRLRKIRRYYNVGASISTSTISLAGGAAIMAQYNIPTLGQQMFGLEPIVTMGLWTVGFFAMGWLLGPLIGTGIFQLANRQRSRQMEEKEKDFYARIRKYRVDPTNGASVQNPIPDYYGEKITSVASYRQWLKDQRAFNKKRQSYA